MPKLTLVWILKYHINQEHQACQDQLQKEQIDVHTYQIFLRNDDVSEHIVSRFSIRMSNITDTTNFMFINIFNCAIAHNFSRFLFILLFFITKIKSCFCYFNVREMSGLS